MDECNASVALELQKQREFMDDTLRAHLQTIENLFDGLAKTVRAQAQQGQERTTVRTTFKDIEHTPTGASAQEDVGMSPVPSSRRSVAAFTLDERWLFATASLDVNLLTNTEDLAGSEDDGGSSNASFQDFETQKKQCMLKPSSRKRLVWDVLSIMFIVYDMLAIPVFLGFDSTSGTFTTAMFYVLLAFWTTDIGLTFCTGIYIKGDLHMDPRLVAEVYMKSWLFPDISLVSYDWINFILSVGQQGVDSPMAAKAGLGRTFRILRVLRAMRLVRLMKIRHLLEQLQDHISSEVLHILVKMAKLTALVLMMNHVLACLWFWIGDKADTVYGGWVEEGDFQERSLLYQYLTSLHWSLTQFTTGAMEVNATNVPERAFSVVTLVFALMIFSSFLSSITAAMTQLQQLSSEAPQKMAQLRRYMKTREIPRSLKVRILRYVEHKLTAERRQVQEREVELLELLSDPLTRELKQRIHQPFLVKHPFFEVCSKRDRIALQHICNSALAPIPLSAGDTLFTNRSRDTKMFFCVVGVLDYELAKQKTTVGELSRQANKYTMTSSRSAMDQNQLHSKDWCCEPALWTVWMHVGSMHAVSVAEVLALDANSFADVLQRHRGLAKQVLHYAQAFVAQLAEMALNGSTLSDLALTEAYGLTALAGSSFGHEASAKKEEEAPSIRAVLARAQSRDFKALLGVPSAASGSKGPARRSGGRARFAVGAGDDSSRTSSDEAASQLSLAHPHFRSGATSQATPTVNFAVNSTPFGSQGTNPDHTSKSSNLAVLEI
mmetsp:Transcript_20532/g.46115  ORF Transcript_20532/g.46115 Transcript_20532/m.46115 type:complete len:777 (-) Transcript_20532:212-2542(-)